MNRVQIQHFSDVLCVWAYTSQVRMDEVLATFGDQVRVECHFIDIFGDCPGRLTNRWQDRGGLAAYGEHVREIVERFDQVTVHENIWRRNVPKSSMACHVFLRAVGLLDDPDALSRATWALRLAFFRDGLDVSSHDVQCGIVEELGLDRDTIEAHIASGQAHADYSRDLRLAKEHQVGVSPTLVFNDGRMRLAGNVGYRVIEANLRELLSAPAGESSWC